MKSGFKPLTIVFKVSDNIKEMMIKHYEDMKCEKTPPYAIFQVKDFDCVTTLYESGKVMFQGIGADIEASYWTEQERILNGKIIDTSSKEKKEKEKEEKKVFINESSVGSDEVGTGDYFGPLVVTASFVSKENIVWMQELGVRDSKKLTDDKIIKIAPELIKKIPHTTIILSNKEYNQYHTTDFNMNKVKAILHNKCLLSVIKKDNIKYSKIIVDQFEPEKAYYNHISKVPEKVTNITFMTKAEDQCMSVAASSIISRYIFLKEIKKLSEKYNIEIPLGASNLVDEVGATLVAKYGKDILKDIAKLSFKNTDKIYEIAKTRK
ncbi:MAG: ribonuclease HIII [Candidatus Coprovivens sp.]